MQPGVGERSDCNFGADWSRLAPAARAVVHTGMYCWDIASGRVQCDELMREIFGFHDHSIPLYYTFLDRVHPDDRDRVRAELETAVDERRGSTFTFRIRRPDGRERLLLGSGQVECRPGGRTVRMYGSATDLTGQFGSMATDAAELRFLRTVLANTPDIVALFDLQFRHLYVSPAIERITGQPASAFIGKTNEELGMPPENCREWRAAMEKTVRTGQAGRIGFSTPDQNGVVRHFESRIVPVYDPGGEIASLVSIVSDVSEHAQTIDELQAQRERLSSADRFKDVFISVLAHEMRNPLAPIRSALGVLRLSRQEAVVDRACEIIERQTAQLVNLVDDLLDLSRVREGKFSLRLQRMDVRAALHSAMEAVEVSFREKQQSLTPDIPDEPIMITGDPTRIVQVFVNLLSNASKFTSSRGHVLLHTALQDAKLVVTVRDDGIGMDADQLDNLFMLFHQHQDAGERTSGLGIGLMLVREIVEAHGGTVVACSAGRGQGTTFTVTLPLSS